MFEINIASIFLVFTQHRSKYVHISISTVTTCIHSGQMLFPDVLDAMFYKHMTILWSSIDNHIPCVQGCKSFCFTDVCSFSKENTVPPLWSNCKLRFFTLDMATHTTVTQ